MKRLIGITLLVTVATAQAADPNGDEPATNVIGSQEAPTVLNVVPWKDREVKLEKKDPTSALLNRVLEPLDREVLTREIEYHRLLSRESDNDGMFLE